MPLPDFEQEAMYRFRDDSPCLGGPANHVAAYTRADALAPNTNAAKQAKAHMRAEHQLLHPAHNSLNKCLIRPFHLPAIESTSIFTGACVHYS